MACAICKTRREKRRCPGVQGEICTLCCGTQREETISCPLDCEYLQLAHAHEKTAMDPARASNIGDPVPEEFVERNVELITVIELAILQTALERNAIDFDIRDALDGLVRTYRTLGSGLYFESRPANSIAAAIFDGVQQRIADIRKLESERGLHKFKDSQILTVFVFLQQVEYALSNNRKRGRRFVTSLCDTLGESIGGESMGGESMGGESMEGESTQPGPASSSLIIS